jgi:hypothetical protein
LNVEIYWNLNAKLLTSMMIIKIVEIYGSQTRASSSHYSDLLGTGEQLQGEFLPLNFPEVA